MQSTTFSPSEIECCELHAPTSKVPIPPRLGLGFHSLRASAPMTRWAPQVQLFCLTKLTPRPCYGTTPMLRHHAATRFARHAQLTHACNTTHQKPRRRCQLNPTSALTIVMPEVICPATNRTEHRQLSTTQLRFHTQHNLNIHAPHSHSHQRGPSSWPKS